MFIYNVHTLLYQDRAGEARVMAQMAWVQPPPEEEEEVKQGEE